MNAGTGLVLMLVRVSLGVETFCDGRQNKAQCYGALGGTVLIQLMDVPEKLTLTWLDPNKQAERWISNELVVKTLSKKVEFVSDRGAVRVKNLIRADDGEYKFEIHNEDGRRRTWRTLQLNIQAPVSSVQLKSECLSQGVKRMSCSSEGDSPHFSWTLDGDALRDDLLFSGNSETTEIKVKATVSGRLVCTASNHVSKASGAAMTPACGYVFIQRQLPDGTNITQWVSATTTRPSRTSAITPDDPQLIDDVLLTLLVRTLAVIIIFSGIFIYFTWKTKKNCEKNTGSVRCHRMEHEDNSVIMVEMRID